MYIKVLNTTNVVSGSGAQYGLVPTGQEGSIQVCVSVCLSVYLSVSFCKISIKLHVHVHVHVQRTRLAFIVHIGKQTYVYMY